MKHEAKVILVCLIALMISVFISGCGLVKVAPKADKDIVVANVSGEDIKKDEFNKIVTLFKTQYEQGYQVGPEVWDRVTNGVKFIDDVKVKILDRMIEERLVKNKAKELGITITDADINAELDKFKALFNSEDKFNEFLTTQKMTIEDLKDSLKSDLYTSRLRDKLTATATVTDAEIMDYYGKHINEFYEIKASHILVATVDEAKKVNERLKAGEDFAKLAKELSTDPSAKENGGELGVFKFGDMVEEFYTAAVALKVGEISGPVQTQYGFHIIKIEDKKLKTIEVAHDELLAKLMDDKKTTEFNKVIEDIKAKADIKKFPKNL